MTYANSADPDQTAPSIKYFKKKKAINNKI